jgi:hypothetical protein
MLLALSLLGCRSAPPPPAVAPKPVYTPEEAALFNDLFRPELFGNPSFAPSETDGLLPERATTADSIFVARVVTITLDEGKDGQQSYSIVVVPAGPAALAGRTITESVSLTVPGNSPAFAWLQSAPRNWVGSRVLLFLRFYEDGPHFHAAPDTSDVRAAVLRAKVSEPSIP